MRYDFVIHRISNIIVSAHSFKMPFLGPAKSSRQSSIYSPTSMDFSWRWRGGGGGGGGGGGVISHEFEPLYSFVEFIFSLLLILVRVFSKYLIRITPL